MSTPKYKTNAHQYLMNTIKSVLEDFLEEYYPGTTPDYLAARYSLQYSPKIDAFQLELTLSELDLVFLLRISSNQSHLYDTYKDFDSPDGEGMIDGRVFPSMLRHLNKHNKSLYNACRALFFKYPDSGTLYGKAPLLATTVIVDDYDLYAVSPQDPSGYVETLIL